MLRHRDHVERLLAANREFKAEYEKPEPAFAFRQALIEARLAAGLTQRELAQKMGTKQSAISRLETQPGLPDLATIQRLSRALGHSFHITIAPDAPIQITTPKGRRKAPALDERGT